MDLICLFLYFQTLCFQLYQAAWCVGPKYVCFTFYLKDDTIAGRNYLDAHNIRLRDAEAAVGPIPVFKGNQFDGIQINPQPFC